MQVFLSHSHQDDVLAAKLAKILELEGVNVWDDREIFPGDNWAALVGEALVDSDAMIILLSSNALASLSVKREIEYALGKKNYKDRVIPVLVGDQKLLETPEFPWILKKLNIIQLSENEPDEEGLKRVIDALRKVA